MKVLCLISAIAVGATVLIQPVSAELFKVKIAATSYDSTGETLTKTPIANAVLIGECTLQPGAQLVAKVDDVEQGPTVIVTVNPCGVILCTNYVVAGACHKGAIKSNGKTEAVTGASIITFTSGDSSVSGGGFFTSKAVGNPTNSADVISFSAKGVAALCNTNGDVISAKITISGPFKAVCN